METTLTRANETYAAWNNLPLNERLTFLPNLAQHLLENKTVFAAVITSEMQKPIAQAIAEVEKCALLCTYYFENASSFLSAKIIKTEASESFVTYEPLGVILGIMPWNFPFWQVFRYAIPALVSGNTVVVKHASNVPKCAQLLQDLFEEAGFPLGCYQNLALSSVEVEEVIANPIIKAVSLTGSEFAGKAVAAIAGKHLKKCVLELGGNNAFIVLEDADIEAAVAIAVNARMQNAGQSCIAAKRFLVHESIADAFIFQFKAALQNLKTGDIYDKATQIGPLARLDLAAALDNQVQKSIAMGAQLILGGTRDGAFYAPTLLAKVTPQMPVFTEETFGPVAAITTFSNLDEAIALSNQSNFGLGVSIFTQDIAKIKTKIAAFNEGAVFINEMVKSDPRLPFGGVKNSGYGRELAEEGLKEFVNTKTVFIKCL
ncbi:NAD-dependent succinate-semialdehyde dehydrogenase [Flavobacterium sp.]|jgi:succinate-semialdehyde dehydrogenase/glutarate-semialdehyde dehydrogenase|uniref:NAD-dependent succinate-semialdehyde dehydrogenase n=1 Tax=Flavobacterium sp. TaxID=239 RepID=UPI0037C14566